MVTLLHVSCLNSDVVLPSYVADFLSARGENLSLAREHYLHLYFDNAKVRKFQEYSKY